MNLLKFKLIVVLTIFVISLYATDTITSIYDIQFTTNPGFDGTFPSPLVNQNVTVQGIVTASGFESGRIFISDRRGGAWSGIAIEPIRNRVSIGDFIEVQGRVSEIMGMTIITQPQNFKIISRNNSLPSPTMVTAHDALTMEAYESVLVSISNLTCTKTTSGNSLALVEDNTASLNIGNGFNSDIKNDYFIIGAKYNHIVGIVNFSHNRFTLHPRSVNDIIQESMGTQSSSWGIIKSMYR